MGGSSINLSDGDPLQLLDPRIRSRYLLPDHRAQFCPDCLREATCHLLDWTLSDVLACLKHQRVLLDSCPVCHAWVQVQDVVQCQCRECGANLTNATTNYILEPFDVLAQRTIRAWWGLDVPAATSTANHSGPSPAARMVPRSRFPPTTTAPLPRMPRRRTPGACCR